METPLDNQSRWSGLKTRVKSAVSLIAVVAICVFAGGILFDSLVVLAALIIFKEWEGLLAKEQGAVLRNIGYFFTVIPCASMIWLRSFSTSHEFGPPDDSGKYQVFFLIALIAATDIGAYFVGKRFGKHKLAPAISPGKTLEGLAGGVICAIVLSTFLFPSMPLFVQCFVGGVFAVLAQAGDLMQSWVKRRAGVKDAGTLIPGHGGLLDRVDGYLFAAPAYAFLVFWTSLG